MLTAGDTAAVARVEQDSDIAIIAKLARRFTALVRACNASQKTDVYTACSYLNIWVAEAGISSAPVIETFTACDSAL